MNAQMLPVTFGTVQTSLLGAYHPPTQRAHCTTRAVARVLCSAIDWEAIAAQRADRYLAEKLAKQGHSGRRFDAAGTGNSRATSGSRPWWRNG